MKRIAHGFLLLLISLSLLAPTAGFTQERDFESHGDIIAAAKDLIEHALSSDVEAEINIAPLDIRLNLNKCDQALDAFIPAGSDLIGRTTVGVRCTGRKPWKIFVAASISIYSDVVVAVDYITRGTNIQADQVKTVKKETSLISRGYYSTPDQVVGKVAKYIINKDGIIYPSSVAKPKLVMRGKEVVILARSGEIVVKMRGKAISDGSLGDLVQIRNSRSHRIVQGEVIDSNLVQVTM